MKKASAILFFAIYLLATTEARQLLKLPVIFHHYTEHQQEDPQITILQFLSIHYMHGSPKDKDYDRDMQLPFKACGNCVSVFANAFVPLSVQVSIVQPILIREQKIYTHPDRFFISTYLSNIWQPPKYS